MATMRRTWNDSDDAGYWANQARINAEPASAPRVNANDEWTREVTIERRAAWNAAVKSGHYVAPSGGVAPALIAKALGYSFMDLKHHVARHGL